jgi:hypothetical protein
MRRLISKRYHDGDSDVGVVIEQFTQVLLSEPQLLGSLADTAHQLTQRKPGFCRLQQLQTEQRLEVMPLVR